MPSQSQQSEKQQAPSQETESPANSSATPDQESMGNAAVQEDMGSGGGQSSGGGGQSTEAPPEAPPAGSGGAGAQDSSVAEGGQGSQGSGVDVSGADVAKVEGGQASSATPSSEPQAHELADSGASITTGNDAVDQHLDNNASTDVCQEKLAHTTDWVDNVNMVRGHPMGEAAINVGERLIPFYGAYDAVRDGWNGLAEQAEMINQDDTVMRLILCAQFSLGVVADLISHIAYLGKCIGYVAVLIAGAGLVINLIISAADMIAVYFDLINSILGIAGSAWCAHKANTATDPQEAARYKWLQFKQAEHAIVSWGSAIVGAVSVLASGGQAPGAAGREAGKQLTKVAIKEAVKGAAKGGAIAGTTKGGIKWLMGSAAPPTKPAPVVKLDKFPKDIIGDATWLTTNHPVGEFILDKASADTKDKVDRLITGKVRPPTAAACIAPALLQSAKPGAAQGAAENAAEAPPTMVDHSPSQAADLAEAVAAMDAAIATNQESQQSSAEGIDNAGMVQQELTQATEAAAGGTEMAQSSSSDLDAAIPVGQEIAGGWSGMVSQMGELSGELGNMGGAIGSAADVSQPNLSPKEDQSLMEKAKAWLLEKAMSAIMSAGSTASSTAGDASSKQGEASSEASGAEGQMQGSQGEAEGSVAETQQAAGEAQAGVGSAQQNEANIQGELAAAHSWESQMVDELARHEGEGEGLLAERDEIQSELDRQLAANEAFAAEWGPWFDEAQAAGDAPTLDDAHVDMLWTVHDEVAGLGDECVAEGASLVSGLPGGIAEGAQANLDVFMTAHTVRMGAVMGLISAASGQVGSATTGAWAAYTAAEGAIISAEQETLESWAELVGSLLGVNDIMTGLDAIVEEEEAAEQESEEQATSGV